MMMPIEQAAVFLLLVGQEKGQKIIALMDTGEIKAIIPVLRRLTDVSPHVQELIWAKFKDLGYEADMNPAELLTLIRFLFSDSKFC